MALIPTQPIGIAKQSVELATKMFSDIRIMTRDKQGVSRSSYGDGETKAIDYLIKVAHDLNLTVRIDAAANVTFQIGEETGERHILSGSHMDSVPEGGNFDGLAGVIAGITVLADFVKNGIKPKTPLKVIAIRGEESAWYGRTYIGTKALFGMLKQEDLQASHRDTGEPLADAMKAAGADLEKISAGQVLINTDEIAAFVEVHIEQGPVLVDRDWPVAIVSGIRGNSRHREIHCAGAAGHSGAVPRWLRQDSVFAAAQLISRMDEHWATILQHGGDLVLTAGIFHTDINNHAMSRIPGDLTFSFEARSQDQETLDALEALLKSECVTIARERKVIFEFDELTQSAPAVLDKKIIEGLVSVAKAEGLTHEIVPSGAGHDASIFSNAGIPTGMIFVRNENGSHNPDEAMEIDDFIAGVAILKRFVMEYVT